MRAPRQDPYVKELAKMKQYAEAGMPCGSIAIVCDVEFGHPRTADGVRGLLRSHFGWKAGKPRGGSFRSAG